MKNWRLICLLLLCYAGIGAASAQNCSYTLRGTVLQTTARTPVIGATVQIKALNIQGATDRQGHFTFSRLCAGKVTVEVQSIGYKTLTKEVTLPIANIEVEFLLTPDEGLLKSIEVVGHKEALESTTTANTLSQQELDQSRGGTLADALTQVAGVNMLQTGATIAKPVIHGLHSNRVLILNNGIRQEGQQWGAEHAPEIDPFIAQRMTVVKGAEAVRFGPEAIGGVVIVEPPVLPIQGGINGEVNLVGNTNGRAGTASAMLSGGLNKLPGLGWRVQGTVKKAGNLKTADYYMDNTGVREKNFSGALGYSNEKLGIEGYFSRFETELGIFKGSHIGNEADILARIENGRPFEEGSFYYSIDAPRQQVTHDLYKLKGHLHLSDNLKLNALYGYQRNQRQEYDLRRAGRTSIPSIDLALTTQTIDVYLERSGQTGWKTIVGLNGILQVNNNIPGTQATPLIPNYDSQSGGAYLIQRLVKESFELDAGVRYDYKTLDALGYDRNQQLYGGTRQFHNFSGSLGGIWYFRPQWSVRSNLGLAWRPPTVNELYSNGLHHGVAAIERGNADLESEQGYKWINTLEYKAERYRLELTGYAQYINNYIYLNPAMETQGSTRGTFPVFDYKQTNARFIGADLFFCYKFKLPMEYELKGSLVRAKNITQDLFLPWIPSDRLSNSLRWRLGESTSWKESYVQVQHQWVRRQTRYEPNSDYVAPPSGYQLLNLSAGTQWEVGEQSLGINFSVNNLTNTLYRDYMNRFRYYTHDLGRSFILRLTYRF